MSSLSEKIETVSTELENLVAQVNEASKAASEGQQQALILSGKLQALKELEAEEKENTSAE